jgi:hypothetical protein
MSKFLKLLNENLPSNADVMDELKNAGVDIEETPGGFIIKISVNTGEEEESEDPISSAVKGMATSPKSPIQSQAKKLVDERKPLEKDSLRAFEQANKQLAQALQILQQSSNAR